MTALTIDLDDRLIEALRETAARLHTTVDDIMGSAVSEIVARRNAPKSFRELADEVPLNLEPGRVWDRERTHDRTVLR